MRCPKCGNFDTLTFNLSDPLELLSDPHTRVRRSPEQCALYVIRQYQFSDWECRKDAFLTRDANKRRR